MNRAGLADTVFELDDFVTAYTAKAIHKSHLDAGKLLLRLNPESVDARRTLEYCVHAIESLSELNLPVFLEPLAVPHSTDDLVKLVGVASALGSSSVNRWLKLPMTDDFVRVAQATTCPIVLLGGDNVGSVEELLQTTERCLDTGANVRGLMIGRSVMYPKNGEDPASVAAKLAACVHRKSVDEVRVWEGL